MFTRLLLLFLITPIVELAILIRLGGLIGFWPTIAIIAATALLGSYLVKKEGLAVWRRFNQRLGSGELPGTELVDGVIILMAGTLLVTPGVLTDIIGLAGLLAPSRALLRRQIMARLQRSIVRGTMSARFETHAAEGDGATSGGNGWRGAGVESPRHQKREEPPREG